MSSRIPGFYKLSMEERRKKLKELVGLTDEDLTYLDSFGKVDREILDAMIENVVGAYPMPLGLAVNFKINGRDYVVPMVIEESSVVAAASNAAKYMRDGDGILSIASDSIMIGQIQLVKVSNPYDAKIKILSHKDSLLEVANQQSRTLRRLGGGAKDLKVRIFPDLRMVITYLYVDVKDAMGANVVNTMCEALAPIIEELTGEKTLLKIISNYADRRIVRSIVKIDIGRLGMETAEGIVEASKFAEVDPYRAVTHNKGIMNGVIAVAQATGQDTRAIEAAAHSYASRSGVYKPLSTWRIVDKYLVGYLEMPMPIGIVGGATKVHPIAKISLKILNIKSARELSEIMGAVGLAQNFAALKALVTEGIQKGHMKLHARNLAIMAGAKGELIDRIAEELIREGEIKYSKAIEIYKKFLSREG